MCELNLLEQAIRSKAPDRADEIIAKMQERAGMAVAEMTLGDAITCFGKVVHNDTELKGAFAA